MKPEHKIKRKKKKAKRAPRRPAHERPPRSLTAAKPGPKPQPEKKLLKYTIYLSAPCLEFVMEHGGSPFVARLIEETRNVPAAHEGDGDVL